MFALDLFNTPYEKELQEGAVDNTVARLIEPLSLRAAEIRTQLRNGNLKGSEMAALEKEYEDLVAKRLDIIHGRQPTTQDECMGYGGLGEAGPRPEDVPAYLRKQQGQAPLTPAQVKGPRPDTLSDPRNLEQARGEQNPLEEQDTPATVAQGIYNEMIRAWQDEKDYIVLPFPDSHNATLTRPQLWNALVTLGQVTPNRRAKYVESKFNDFETFMRWASQLKRYKVPPKQKKNAQMDLGIQPAAVAPTANPQTPVAEAQKKNSEEPDLTGNTAQDASVQRELQRVRARHPAARSDIEALVKDEIVNQERVNQEIEHLETIDSQQDDKLNQVLSLNTQQEQEITRLNQQLASLDGKLNQALGRAPATTPTTAPTKQVAEPTQPGTVSAPAPVSAPTTEPGATAEPVADKSAAEIARLEKQIQQLELVMTLKTPAQQDDLRDRIDALEKERDAKIEKQQAATAKGVATRKANKAKAAAAVATDTAAKTTPKEKPADDELPFKGKGQAPGMGGISAMAGSNKSTAKSKYQKGGHDYLSDILSGAGKEHLTPDEQDQEIKFNPAELTSENTDNPLDQGSGQQLRRTPDIRRIKQVKDYERMFKQDMANRVQDRDADDDEQDLRDVDETRAAIYRVGDAKPKFRYGTEAQHGLYGRVQVGRTDDDGRVQIHYQRNGKNYSHPVDPNTLNRTGDKVAEGNMKALATAGQSVPAVAGTYTVCKRKGADWVAIQPHDSKESAERHAQNIKNKYPSMQMAVRDPSGNYTEIGVKKPSAASKPSQAYNDGAADRWYHRPLRNDYAKGTKDHQDYIDGYSGRRFTKEGVTESANLSNLTPDEIKGIGMMIQDGHDIPTIIRIFDNKPTAEQITAIATANMQQGVAESEFTISDDPSAHIKILFLKTINGNEYRLVKQGDVYKIYVNRSTKNKKVFSSFDLAKKALQQLLLNAVHTGEQGVAEMDKSQRPPSRHGDYPLGAKGTTVKPTTPKKVVKDLTKVLDKAFDTKEVKEDTGSWIVYDPETKQIKKRFKTHTAGKSYANTHGLGFASSEYYFDQVKDKQPVAETVTDIKSEMAKVYRRLAPKIERYRDSFLAGQLYDELENIAELHGAEAEFKRMMAGARNRAHMDYDTNPGGFQNWFWYLPFEDEELNEVKEIRTREDFLRERDRLYRLVQLETDPASKQIIRTEIRNLERRAAEEGWVKFVNEESSTSSEAVERAILHRIMVDDKLRNMAMDVGMDKMFQAVEEVAYNVGDVDEIGTRDVSAYVNQVKQILGVDDSYDDADEFGMPGSEFFPDEKLDEKWSQKYKSSINCTNPKGFSQKAHCAGRKK